MDDCSRNIARISMTLDRYMIHDTRWIRRKRYKLDYYSSCNRLIKYYQICRHVCTCMDHSLRHCQHKADIKGKKDDSDTSTSDIRCSCMVAHYWITAATTWSLGIGESVIGWMTTTATCSGLISEARYCRHASTAPFIYMTRTSWISAR